MKLIIWDFDGTLADSHALIEAGMNHTLGILGLSENVDLRQSWLSGVGLPVEEGLRRTFGGLALDPAQVFEIYRSFDWKAHEHLLTPFEGMDDLLKNLHTQGIPMAIASSKRSVSLRRQVATFGWTDYFDPIITPDEVTHGKPHPESVFCCLQAHGLQPDEAIMIGDTPFDLDMARAAGVPSIAVGHGFYDKKSLEACLPSGYAANTSELRKLLMKITAQ